MYANVRDANRHIGMYLKRNRIMVIKRIDITGKKFGRLFVIGFSHISKRRASYWYVKCDCGTKKITQGSHLKNGRTKSCGCLHRQITSKIMREIMFKHGMKETPIYRVWTDMKQRCLNPNRPKYKNYGGRGIKVCDRWLNFENFYKDMGEKPKNKSLDRIENNGDYTPENCKWSTQKQQCNNRQDNVVLSYKGDIFSVAEWGEKLKMNSKKLYKRIYRGWSVERTLETP